MTCGHFIKMSRTNNVFGFRDRHTNLSTLPKLQRSPLRLNDATIVPVTNADEIIIVFYNIQVGTATNVLISFQPLVGTSQTISSSTVLHPPSTNNVSSTAGMILNIGNNVDRISGRITLQKFTNATSDIWVGNGTCICENTLDRQIISSARLITPLNAPLTRFVVQTTDGLPTIAGEMWVFY